MIERLAFVHWQNDWPYLMATFIFGYVLGSIPFGLIFGWMAGAGDVRKIGSGNIGATNVLRAGKKWAAAATLLCDALKGAIAVLVARYYLSLEVFYLLAGFGAFIGHLHPVWLRFKGGKGVATFLGIVLAIALPMDWPVALLTCVSWVVGARTFRASSMGALVAATATPIYFYLWNETLFSAFTAVLSVLIFLTHRSNIHRLMHGEEGRIGMR